MDLDELVSLLLQIRTKHSGRLLVVLSKDSEGNEFSPLFEVKPCFYTQRNSYQGEADNAAEGEQPNALCLWPSN